jgi:hypothetical protein
MFKKYHLYFGVSEFVFGFGVVAITDDHDYFPGS